jgi:hypothetical protein
MERTSYLQAFHRRRPRYCTLEKLQYKENFMKALAFVFSLVLAVPLVATASDLTGVHTVYLGNLDLRAQRDIKIALKKELPQVSVVNDPKDAAVTLEFGGQAPSSETVTTTVNVQKPGITNQPGSEMVAVQVPTDTTISNPGHVVVTAVTRDGHSLVLHEGPPMPFTANHAAAAFIAAWRDANRL